MPSVHDDETTQCPNCKRLQAALEETQKRLAQVEARLEELERESHRQAAPFRRPPKKRKPNKDKPGRKQGHKPAYRKPPPTVDEFAQVPLDQCPDCGGPVHDVRAVEQIIEDIPQVKVHRLHLTTYRGRCQRCGPVCSTHPEQVSHAVGAAGTQIGRRALGLAADLNKHYGIPMRKTCDILREHYGLRITAGGLSQALDRMAHKLQQPYGELVQKVRRAPAIYADETGWWVGGESAWLWVFANPLFTLYTIGDRSRQVIRRVLGDDFAGVLISDCLASYDPHPGRKSKCCSHHLKAISQALQQVPGSKFLGALRNVVKAAIFWHGMRAEVDAGEYAYRSACLERNLDKLLAGAHSHPEEIRIHNRFTKHRPHLLTFLHVPEVDPTNNLAERQLRPAVIARKLSCGNQTLHGAATFEVLKSLSVTCRQQGHKFAEFVADWLRVSGRPPPLFASS